MRVNPPLALNISEELKAERSTVGLVIQVKDCDVGQRRSIRLAHVDCVYSQGWSIVILINNVDVEGCRTCHWRFAW